MEKVLKKKKKEKSECTRGIYTKNGHFHPLIPLPTTELEIR